MDLKRLGHLVALAEERNFARAAKRVHLSQPAFSRSIQVIEAEFGLPLFERGGAEAVPSPAGSFLIDRARKLLFDSRCLERDVGLFCQRLMGDLTFGAGPYAAATLLPALLGELRQGHPEIKLRVEVNNGNYLVQQLRLEEIDFFVADTRELSSSPDLKIKPLARQPSAFYVRSGHPLPARQRVRPAEMLPFGIATVRVPQSIRAGLLTTFGLPADAAPPLALECDDIHLLKHVALGTDTILAASHAVVREEVRQKRLRPLDVAPLPKLSAEMGIVSLSGRSFAPMAQWAVERLAVLAAQSGR